MKLISMFNFNFHDFNLQMLAQFFQAHPYSASIFTYVISFIEAMAVIGTIIPGTIAIPAIGFLIGSGIIPAGSTFMWAMLGAITGDCLSYFIGVYFQDRIHRMWPFTRWPSLLERSEKFFRNHGGKSVLFARFVGPMRAMMPMIAGMFKMSLTRFLFAAVPSAAVWTVIYLIPGALLGALALELPTKVAAKFTLWVFVAMTALGLIIWFLQLFFRQFWQMIDYYIMQLWRYLHKHNTLFRITKFLSDPKKPDNHWQLTLALAVIGIIILFLWVVHQVLISGVLIDTGYSIYHLLRSLRFTRLDHIAMLITFFGDLPLILFAAGIIFLWLFWHRQKYVAMHWLGITVLSTAMAFVIKFLVYSQRPGDISYGMHSPSFPSAHAALSLALYGFLAVIIVRELKTPKKYFVYIVAGVLTTLISISRLYLGAHWLADVLGGILLGLAALLVVTISYRRKHILHFPVHKFTLTVIGIFVAVWIGYTAIMFKREVKKYTLIWPTQTITLKDLKKREAMNVPLYRLNRLGQPIEAFNVLYAGDLSKISQILLQQGWEQEPISFDLQNIIKSFSATSIAGHLTIFPELYRNKKPALLFTKSTKQDGEMLILRLWESDISLKDSNLPLWIGMVEYSYAAPHIFSLKHAKKKHLFIGATEFLAKHLGKKEFNLWERHYFFEQQPIEIRELHWDGRLLVVSYK